VTLARPRHTPAQGPGRGAVSGRWGRERRGAQPPPASAPLGAVGADADRRPSRLRV